MFEVSIKAKTWLTNYRAKTITRPEWLTRQPRTFSHLNHDDRRRNVAARVEVERLASVGHDFIGQAAGDHLGQGLLLGLSLTGELSAAVTKPSDVVLVEKKMKT